MKKLVFLIVGLAFLSICYLTAYELELNAFELTWYVGAGYEFPVFTPPFDGMVGGVDHEEHARILRDGVELGVRTPYIFGAPGNLEFLEGEYIVIDDIEPLLSNWLPVSVTFFSITTNYAADFLGYNEPVNPVELSSFTAALTSQNNVELSWVTQTETNMLGYRVYRNDSENQANSVMITPTLVGATNTSEQHVYTVTDAEVELGQMYYYWLESVDANSSSFHGPVSVVVQGNVPPVLPEISSIRNAYPNPFKANTSTTIEVSIKEGESGTVSIFNLNGQIVKSYSLAEGTHNVNWSGLDSNGTTCSSGIYFYKLSTPSINQIKKLVVIK